MNQQSCTTFTAFCSTEKDEQTKTPQTQKQTKKPIPPKNQQQQNPKKTKNPATKKPSQNQTQTAIHKTVHNCGGS